VRALFSCQPGVGHLNGLVTIARALVSAGHEVLFGTARSFLPSVEAAGFPGRPAGFDWLESDHASLPQLRDGPGNGSGIAVFAELADRGMVHDLVALGRDWGADLVVRDAVEFGGWVAGERLGVPAAAIPANLGLPRQLLVALAGHVLEGLPERHGLAPDPLLRRLAAHPYMHSKPPRVDVPGFEAFADDFRFQLEVFAAAVAPAVEDGPAWLTELGGRPVIHVSLGTVVNNTGTGIRVNAAVLEALAGEDVDVILMLGRDTDPAVFGRQPPSVRLLRYLPHTQYLELLKRSDVVVNHGGYNTVMAAVACGRPVCFLPLEGDQPVVAHRFTELGVGTSCADVPAPQYPFPVVDVDRLDPAAIRAAVLRAVEDPRHREAAVLLRDEVRELPPPAAAVTYLEQRASRP